MERMFVVKIKRMAIDLSCETAGDGKKYEYENLGFQSLAKVLKTAEFTVFFSGIHYKDAVCMFINQRLVEL